MNNEKILASVNVLAYGKIEDIDDSILSHRSTLTLYNDRIVAYKRNSKDEVIMDTDLKNLKIVLNSKILQVQTKYGLHDAVFDFWTFHEGNNNTAFRSHFRRIERKIIPKLRELNVPIDDSYSDGVRSNFKAEQRKTNKLLAIASLIGGLVYLAYILYKHHKYI